MLQELPHKTNERTVFNQHANWHQDIGGVAYVGCHALAIL